MINLRRSIYQRIPKGIAAYLRRTEKAALATMLRPVNTLKRARAGRRARNDETGLNHRIWDYDKRLLPNEHLGEVENALTNGDMVPQITGLSMGYPAWNLLYYAAMTSLPVSRRVVLVETGTNLGLSTVVLASVLKNTGRKGIVHTVDIDSTMIQRAKENWRLADVEQFVKAHCGDSIEVLGRLSKDVDFVDFAFLDGNHAFRYVATEFDLLFPGIVAARGTVYFDNTRAGGVAEALRFIKSAYGGNLIEFGSCSWGPPGNAVWQP